MNTEKTRGGKAKQSMLSTLRYFLKGNMIFAINGIVIAAIDSVANIFPPLFQQVYTDNIITRKSPEWFTPLIALYVMIFLIEMSTWVFFSIVRRNSQAKISITSSSNFIWTVLRLPMTRLSQFTPGELVARYTTIPRTIRMLDYNLPIICCLILPAVCCYIVMLYNWQLGLLELFSILLLIYVMRSTAKMQKKISM